MAEAGSTTRAVGEAFGCSSACVSYWVRRNGVRRPRTVPVTGNAQEIQRRRSLVVRLAQRVRNLKMNGEVVREVPQYPTLGSICRALHEKGIDVSKMTVCNDLKRAGFACRVRPRVPDTSHADCDGRYQFCRTLRRFPKSFFERCVVTDEKIFTSNDHTSRTMYVRKGKKAMRRERRRWPRATVMVWGAIGINVRSLFICPEHRLRTEEEKDDDVYTTGRPKKKKKFTVTKKIYIRSCLAPLIPQLLQHKCVLQEDGASAHGSKQYLARKGVQRLEDIAPWPSRSPQLSPIETLWAILQRRVAEHHTSTRDELITAIKEEWEALSEKEVHALVRSLRTRITDCWNAKGVI